MLKILNDKSIKYRRFSLIMIGILDKKFLFAINILTSCNQKIESRHYPLGNASIPTIMQIFESYFLILCRSCQKFL